MKPLVTIYTKEQGKIEFATFEELWGFDDPNITYHREDGPAVEWTNGTKFYYRNGELHRADGPAMEFANGYKEYWLNGKRLSEEEFILRILKYTPISILKYLLHKLEKKGD